MNYKILLFLVFNILNGEIHVFNRQSGLEASVSTLSSARQLYVSAKELAVSLTSKIYENTERKKLVLYIGTDKIKISGNSSYVIINDEPFQMMRSIRIESKDLYIPLKDFTDVLQSTIMPGINFDENKQILEVDVLKFNINDISIDIKSNGTIIKLTTKKPFSENGISSFINKHGWFYLTVSGGVIDTSTINSGLTRGVVRQIESDQIGKTAQVAFKLGSKVVSHEWYQNTNPNELVIVLRTPLGKLEDHIEDFTSDIVTRFSDELSQELLDKHKNDTKVLTSGSLSFLVHKIGNKLGIDNCFGTDPEYLEGQFTGRVEGRPNFSQEKVRRINKWIGSKKFDQIFSYSDSIHDLPLLEFADFPMAISPDKELRRVAKEREWLIDDRRSS